jgi:cobalt-zinc-cadmium efflux system outer membrane protein
VRAGHARAAALASAALLAACSAVSVPDERATLDGAVLERTGARAAASKADTTDEVLELLRAPLDDDAAVRIALLHNRRVRAAYERLGIARADLVQAGLLRNPVFDGDARFFANGTELELGLAQPFLDLFFRPLRERAAEHDLAAAQAWITAELVDLVFAVRRALVALRAAERTTDLHREALQAASAAHELAVALHAVGNFTDQELARERLGETRARLDLSAAELAAAEAREAVQVLLGLWGEQTQWRSGGTLGDDALAGLDLAHVETRAIERSLALAAHRAGIQAFAQRAGLTSWQRWFPDGALGLSAVREPGGDWGLGPHLAFELPFFDGRTTARERIAREIDAALHEEVQLAVEIRGTARTLRERAVHLADRARFLREVHLPQRAELLRTTLQTYNAMQIGAFDVLLQRQQQVVDQREHLATLRDAHLARLDLQQLLAGGMPARSGHERAGTDASSGAATTTSRETHR